MSKMTKQLLCPKCGKTQKETGAFIEGFCPICYFDQHSLISLRHTPKVKVCPRCEAYWSSGQWVERGNLSTEEHLYNMACDILDPLFTPEHPATFEIQILNKSKQPISRVKEIRVEVTAHAQKTTFTESKIISLLISPELCDTCRRVSGGYFEGVLQVRASTGKLTKEQEETIVTFMNERLADLGTPSGAIKLTYSRGGIDFRFISSRLCRSLAKQLATHFGLLLGVSSKVVGRTRDGKVQTRQTHVVRYPPFTVGDVLTYENRIYLVSGIRNGNYVLIDLESGHRQTHSPKELSLFEGKSLNDEIFEYQVISKTPEFFQLMSQSDYTIYDIQIPPFPLEVGTTIRAVLWKNRPHFIPPTEE
ncbi:MAG: NMD3-related protein [Promethearchaeota archaeon]